MARIRQIDYSIERRILIGLIISDEFVRNILDVIQLQFFQNPAARAIAKWCLSYYKQYGETPKQHIEQIYEDKQVELDEQQEEFVAELLTSISEEYDEDYDAFNAAFHTQRAVKYFKKRQLQELAYEIDLALESDKVDLAENLLEKYKPVEHNTEDCFDPFESDEVVKDAFASVGKPLFRLPGALGSMMNYQFYRASFIGFQGPEKVGKTWFLQELMIRALRNKRRVVFFEAGDLTKEQRMCRLYARIAQKPWIPGMKEGEVEVRIPVWEDEELLTEFEIDTVKVPVLTVEDALKARQVWARRAQGKCLISVHTSTSLNVKKIDRLLTKWETMKGFVPDVIIIDYADILAPEDEYGDDRAKINNTWKALRALSQKWQCCVITATQSDAASYERGTQSLTNFSEDKRKYSHVTAMFALNKSPGERELDFVLRVSPLLIREGVHTIKYRQVAVFANIAKAQPFYKSAPVRKPLA